MSVSWRRRHRLPAPERRSGNARSPPSLCVVRASGRICPDRPRPQRERCPPPRGEARAPCPLGAEARRGHVALSGCRARRCFLQSVERAFDLLQALRGDSRIVRRRLDVGVSEDALQDPYILAQSSRRWVANPWRRECSDRWLGQAPIALTTAFEDLAYGILGDGCLGPPAGKQACFRRPLFDPIFPQRREHLRASTGTNRSLAPLP